jgi:mannose-6-phosphate isomerase
MNTPEIYKFKPILKSVLWGGDKICKLKKIQSDRTDIGESWEVSGVQGNESVVADGKDAGRTLSELVHEYKGLLVGDCNYQLFGDEFPLLIKIIDAQKDLSLQVHPNDELAAKRHNSKGKTEMWYVIGTEPGAELIAGFAKEVHKEEFSDLVKSNGILDVVRHYPTTPGDAFFIPAGLVHGIGAGNLIVEVQQTSDVTYRIYDYDRRDAQGNPRQLHIEESRDAINYAVTTAKVTPQPLPIHTDNSNPEPQAVATSIVQCPYFSVNEIDVNGPLTLPTNDSFLILIAIDGEMTITCPPNLTSDITLRKGETILIPAAISAVTILGIGRLISATC